jgi:general secretion pathway protein G
MKSRKAKTYNFLRRKNKHCVPAALQNAKAAVCDTSGFSLIELVVVVAIIGLLLIIAIPTWSYMITNAKVKRAMADIRTLEKDISAYLAERGTLPPTGAAGLAAIGRADMRDPWNRPYQYVNISLGGTPYQDEFGENLNIDFDVFSRGQNGNGTQSLADPACRDDIIRAGDGGFVGLGEEF